MRHLLFLLALCLTMPAAAGDFYVEGPTVSERAQANALAHAARDEGHRARVVRRYRHGVGWEFAAVVEGLTDEATARGVAQALTRATGIPLTVYARTERDVGPPPEPEEDTDPEVVATRSAPDLLLRAVRAHGGLPSALDRVRQADAVLFRFRRVLPDGSVVLHTYARRGEDLYLDLRVEEGSATSSQTVVVGDRAAMVVGDRVVPRDPEVAREVTGRFDPGHVLGFSLDFPRAATSRREFQTLFYSGDGVEGDSPVHVLRYEGDRVVGRIEVALDQETHLLRRILVMGDAGEVEQRFDGYTELRGEQVPEHVVVLRDGEVVDDLRVVDLDLEPSLPDGWFTVPAP